MSNLASEVFQDFLGLVIILGIVAGVACCVAWGWP